MTSLALLLVPLMVLLGVWQLNRAEFKRGLESAQYSQEGNLPITETQLLGKADPEFAKVGLVGEFVAEEHFLLDNQVEAGKVGYRVIQPFRTLQGHIFLIDRGWLPQGSSREEMPEIPEVSKAEYSSSVEKRGGTDENSGVPAIRSTLRSVRVVARVWPNLGLTPIFGQDSWAPGWPKRIQRLELNRMAAVVGASLPLLLKLESAQPGALTIGRAQFDFKSRRHTGYAFQWFTMAAALLLAYLVYGFRRLPSTGVKARGRT